MKSFQVIYFRNGDNMFKFINKLNGMKRCCSCFCDNPKLVQCKKLVTKNNHATQCKRVASLICNKCKREFCHIHFPDNSIMCEKCLSEYKVQTVSQAKRRNSIIRENRTSIHSNHRRSIELSVSSSDSMNE